VKEFGGSNAGLSPRNCFTCRTRRQGLKNKSAASL